eukprot:TRINITY_DN26288_c0_g1_i1.p1 TRINITY_DN26288_c0_g1~~TRINITY_DN26288_c0_g1_i1.p1  ORF type:complete len:693 (+),score=199.87 TRINITY_DN26288_c0_g1_i1:134-2212(+)
MAVASLPSTIASQQNTAFTGSVGFLSPTRTRIHDLQAGPPGLTSNPSSAGGAIGASNSEEPSQVLSQLIPVAAAASLCGMVAAGRRARRARHKTRQRATSTDRQIVQTFDDVESSVESFVPKISALQHQAEQLRSGELKEVMQTMKDLRKTELRSVFGEVDQLLCALVGAVDGLRDQAQTIRKSELRQQCLEMDRKAQDWVGKVEKDAVETLTGYRAESQEGIETMMEAHVVGLSHHSAPVEVREKLAVAQADWNAYSKELVEFAKTSNGYVVPEVAVLSTCNRFELYFASSEMKKFTAIEAVHAFLRHKSGLSKEELEPYLFTHSGEAATQHLFEVSSGLDSLVLGEAQILSQVKACHEHAIQKAEAMEEQVPGSGGKIVAKMLNAAIRMGKLVRTRTKIGKGSVSVSSAAVELMMSRAMQDIRKPASKLNVCVVGAGKMSRLLLLALFSKHPDIKVTLVNRSVDKAQDVLDDDLVKARGGTNATVAPMDKMWEAIYASDVTFTATGSKVPIIHPEDLKNLEKQLMLIDISVPLNVASGCAEVDKVNSYSVDDLKKVVQANAEKRQSEVDKAKRLISDEVQKFKCWQASQGAVPYLAALQAMAENIRRTEYEKMAHKLQGLQDKEKEALDKLTRHIVDQLFRPIYYSMKEDEQISAKKNKILALRNIFGLEPLYKRGLLTSGQQVTAQLNA